VSGAARVTAFGLLCLLAAGSGPLPARAQPGTPDHPTTGTPADAPGSQVVNVRDASILCGLWVTRWEYRSPEDIAALFSRAADYGLTDIYFQVRGRADAFYRSNLEPWGAELTGTLGRDPGWDPLAVALTQAHTRGLRLHAWINTFTLWSGSTPPPPSEPEHLFRTHPEWIMANRAGQTLRLGNRFGYVLAAPGNPGVQDHLQKVVLDIVSRYRVDGIHFDYIRLPDHDYSYDAVSRGRFLRESESTDTYMGWQAREVARMLDRIAAAARAEKPGLIMSAAIVNHYHRAISIFAQDPVSWVESGALDYVIPMMYTASLAEYRDMLTGYLEVLAPEHVVAGINLGEMPGDPGTLADQVYESVIAGIRGHALFSLAGVDALAGSRPVGSDVGLQGDLYTLFENLRGETFARPAGTDMPDPGRVTEPEPAPEGGLSPAVIERLGAGLGRIVRRAFGVLG